jgi:plastocyanin domain-containing protein
MRMTTLLMLLSLCLLSVTIADAAKAKPVQEATITLTEKGYQPEKVRLRRGVPARLTFIRKFEVTCATEVIIEEYHIRRDLPLNQPVIVEFTPQKAGELEYSCSMKMVGGKITIK